MNHYQNIRQHIKSGDLLAWSHRAPWWSSWRNFKIALVRLFTRSEYCHVGTAWRVADRVFVIEAVMPAVRIFPLSQLTPFYWVPMPEHWTPKVEEYALNHVGHVYSEWDAMVGYFGMPADDGREQCAELSIRIAAQGAIDLGDRATPDAVVLRAQEQGATLTYVVE
jgi:hypothetical protein